MSRSLLRERRRRLGVALATTGVVLMALSAPLSTAAGPAGSSATGGSDAAAGKPQAKVIVTYKARPGKVEKAAIKAAGGTVTHELTLVDGLAATMPAAAINGLRHNPTVESIELDGELVAFADPPTGDLEYDNAWGVRRMGTYPVHQAGIRGAGIKVAVIDTGLDYIHDGPSVDPEFLGNYKGGYDFFNNDADPMDDNGHGTHVAGILAAEHNGYLVVGVAPEVDLYALKVLGASGSGEYSGLIAALGWAVDHDMDVVNISLGGHDVSAALQTAVTAAYNAGVTIVAASGNVVTFQDLLYGCPVAYPAAYAESIAVSFTGQTDQLTGYSCTGTQVDLAAPGDAIFSPVPVGSCMFCSPNGYSAQSGTSMASPHVAGLAALVLSYGIADGNQNGLLADDVKAHLCATAATASYPAKTDSRYPKWYGCGIADADNALLNVPPPGGGSLNHAPVAAADTATLAEDGGPLTIDVLANDSDQDAGTTLSVTSVADPAGGSATVGAGGLSVSYTPDPNAHGTDTFSYTIGDGAGGSASASVTVTVTPVNDPPVAVDDSLATVRDTAANVVVRSNDSDADGDSLTTIAVTNPAHGSAAIQADGSVTYTPAPGYTGSDAFDYTIADPSNGMDVGHVTVSVLLVDQPPVAVDDILTTAEDAGGSVVVLANDTDADGEALSVTAITAAPTHGSASIGANGTVNYTPAPNYNGPDQFSYRVADGAGLSDIGSVAVTVTPVNDAPTAANDSATTSEDQALTIGVLSNDGDVDGDALIVTVTTAGVGTATPNANGTIAYSPPPEYAGSDSFGYTVSDGHGGTATASVSVTINAVNDAPTAADKAASTAYQKPTTITLTGADVEVCDLTFTIVTGPAHGTVGPISNNLCVALLPPYWDSAKVTYTPANGYSGPDSFTYRTSDGVLTSTIATVTMTVAAPIPPVRLHVADLDGTQTAGATSWTAKITILVHNAAHAPVNGIAVNAAFSAGATGLATCRTNAAGVCTISKVVPNAKTSVTFTVNSLTYTGMIYEPTLNHDPETDSNGTVITLAKP